MTKPTTVMETGLTAWRTVRCVLAFVAVPGTVQPVFAQDAAVAAVPASAIDKRMRLETDIDNNPFGLVPHKPNYILPVTYNDSPNNEPFAEQGDFVDEVEMKFQLSIKVLMIKQVFDRYSFLNFGYTNQSYFQIYNRDISSPFRETDHEPEVMLNYLRPFRLGPVDFKINTLGVVHQSNGQTTERSRSWNRVYWQMVGEVGDTYFSFKPWYRIPESEKDGPDDASGDDNPDIEFYNGHFELQVLQFVGTQTLGLTLRNNLRSENRGGVQVDWTFPIGQRLQGYLQLYSGYGESLIDYNDSNTRIGFGLMLTNWL